KLDEEQLSRLRFLFLQFTNYETWQKNRKLLEKTLSEGCLRVLNQAIACVPYRKELGRKPADKKDTAWLRAMADEHHDAFLKSLNLSDGRGRPAKLNEGQIQTIKSTY